MPNLLAALSRLGRPFARQAEDSHAAPEDRVSDRLAQLQSQQSAACPRTRLFRG